MAFQEIAYVNWNKDNLVILTTYSQMQNNVNNSEIYYLKYWGMIVLDESHLVRNANTARYQSIKFLKALLRFLITGK